MTNLRNEGPIGVFDSGLGGLTVLRALHERLPHEDFVYIGDTARTPYGTRGKQTILNYAHACARVLREQRVKLLAIACNTLSAVALSSLDGELFFPVIGALRPGAQAALGVSTGKRIGVLASTRTALADAYPQAFSALDHSARVYVQKSPLLVTLADEGWTEGEVPTLVVREYLKPLLSHSIDTLLLGCSQYPLFSKLIEAELAPHPTPRGRPIAVVDSAQPLAKQVVREIAERQLATERTDPGKLRIVLSDMPEDFTVANRYLGRDLATLQVTAVDL
jgi:glutamate racemase